MKTKTEITPGSYATKKEFFGEYSRYAVAAIHTRFGDVQWFVWDAMSLDEIGLPSVIRQAATKEDAINGIEK